MYGEVQKMWGNMHMVYLSRGPKHGYGCLLLQMRTRRMRCDDEEKCDDEMNSGAMWPCKKCEKQVPFQDLKAGLCWNCQVIEFDKIVDWD